jgi:hypothetical protein
MTTSFESMSKNIEYTEDWKNGYQAAFADIEKGQTRLQMQAKIAAGTAPKESKSFFENTATLVGIFVTIGGLFFSGAQIWVGWNEIDIKKAEALREIIPSLSNEDRRVRQYALTTFMNLEGPSKKELKRYADDAGHDPKSAEIIDTIASRLNDSELKTKAAELYYKSASSLIDAYDAATVEKTLLSAKAKKGSTLDSNAINAIERRQVIALEEAEYAADRAIKLDDTQGKYYYWYGLVLQYKQLYSKANEQYLIALGKSTLKGSTQEYLRTNLELAVNYGRIACFAKKQNPADKGVVDGSVAKQIDDTIAAYQQTSEYYKGYIANREEHEPEFAFTEKWAKGAPILKCDQVYGIE